MRHGTWGALALAGGLIAARVGAQCTPPADSHEARLLAFYEVPIAFAIADAPQLLPLGHVALTGELVGVPAPSATLATPDYCYSGSHDGTHLAPVLPRLRVAVGLPAGFAVEATYLPPVTVDRAQPNLASAALAYVHELPLHWTPTVTLELRAHGTLGSVKGSITCPASALQQTDPNQACYGTNPSHDTYYPQSAGTEAALDVGTPNGRFSVYGGAGYTWLLPRFRVKFTDVNDVTDHTLVVIDLSRVPVFAGASVRVWRGLDLGAQGYVVSQDATTWRLVARYRL